MSPSPPVPCARCGSPIRLGLRTCSDIPPGGDGSLASTVVWASFCFSRMMEADATAIRSRLRNLLTQDRDALWAAIDPKPHPDQAMEARIQKVLDNTIRNPAARHLAP